MHTSKNSDGVHFCHGHQTRCFTAWGLSEIETNNCASFLSAGNKCRLALSCVALWFELRRHHSATVALLEFSQAPAARNNLLCYLDRPWFAAVHTIDLQGVDSTKQQPWDLLIASIGRQMPLLRRLGLNNCQSLDDKGLITGLSTSCSNPPFQALQYVTACYSEHVGPTSVQWCLDNLPAIVLFRRVPAWMSRHGAHAFNSHPDTLQLHTYYPDGSFRFCRGRANMGWSTANLKSGYRQYREPMDSLRSLVREMND